MKETNFKASSLGSIPHDWEVTSIIEISSVNGRVGFKGYTKADLVQVGNGAYTIGGKHISRNKLDLSDPEYISWEKYYESPEIMVHFGDILVAQRGSLGKSALINKQIGPATINPSLVLLNKIKCNNIYLSYYLQCKKAVDYCLSTNSQTGVPMLTQRQIGDMPILLPPTYSKEQERIAEVLSNVDGLIETTEALLQKKRDIKQGTMQQLLSGKHRLPGFIEPWINEPLGKYIFVGKGNSLQAKNFIRGKIPVVAGGQSYAGFHNAANIKQPSITISASGAYAGYVWYHSYPIMATDCSVITNIDCFDLHFVYYWLKYNQETIYKLQTGGAQPHVYPRHIAALPFYHPSSLSEQCAIAKMLSDMDAEIDALEGNLSKYIAIREAMMQQLLTGKIRLI